MSINHNVFLQRQEPGPRGKVILVSVVDAESVGMKESESQVFMMGTLTRSVYTNMNPTITLDNRAKCSAEEFVEIASKETGQFINPTKGMGINGILRGPYWFIRRFQSVMEQMGG